MQAASDGVKCQTMRYVKGVRGTGPRLLFAAEGKCNWGERLRTCCARESRCRFTLLFFTAAKIRSHIKSKYFPPKSGDAVFKGSRLTPIESGCVVAKAWGDLFFETVDPGIATGVLLASWQARWKVGSFGRGWAADEQLYVATA